MVDNGTMADIGYVKIQWFILGGDTTVGVRYVENCNDRYWVLDYKMVDIAYVNTGGRDSAFAQ